MGNRCKGNINTGRDEAKMKLRGERSGGRQDETEPSGLHRGSVDLVMDEKLFTFFGIDVQEIGEIDVVVITDVQVVV